MCQIPTIEVASKKLFCDPGKIRSCIPKVVGGFREIFINLKLANYFTDGHGRINYAAFRID